MSNDPWGPDGFETYLNRDERGRPEQDHWSDVGDDHFHHMPEPAPESATFWKGDGWWVGPLVAVIVIALGLWMFSIIAWEVFNIFTFVCMFIGLCWLVCVIGRLVKHFAANKKTKRKRADEGYTFFPRYLSGYYWAAPFALWGLGTLAYWISNIG